MDMILICMARTKCSPHAPALITTSHDPTRLFKLYKGQGLETWHCISDASCITFAAHDAIFLARAAVSSLVELCICDTADGSLRPHSEETHILSHLIPERGVIGTIRSRYNHCSNSLMIELLEMLQHLRQNYPAWW